MNICATNEFGAPVRVTFVSERLWETLNDPRKRLVVTFILRYAFYRLNGVNSEFYYKQKNNHDSL